MPLTSRVNEMPRTIVEQPRIIHALPGRLRVHVPAGLRHSPSSVEDRLRRVAGVLRIHDSPLTGNVLIHFDPARTTISHLLAVLTTPEPVRTEAAGHAYPIPIQYLSYQDTGCAPQQSLLQMAAVYRQYHPVRTAPLPPAHAEPATARVTAMQVFLRLVLPVVARLSGMEAALTLMTTIMELGALIVMLDEVPLLRQGIGLLFGRTVADLLGMVARLITAGLHARAVNSGDRARRGQLVV